MRWILVLALLAPIAASAAEVLEARDAFHLVGATRIDTGLVLTWAVAPGYAVYRDRIQVRASASGTLTGAPFLPRGVMAADGLGGTAEEYLEPFTMRIPVAATATGLVSVRLQGCHVVEPQVCFPPFTVDVPMEGTLSGFSPRG
ncbi:protein-disulfide reductase DsbD N-terminal domain-containing protein [Rhodanobacter denitrificans]|uniref:protein-disulfide reductase DsbD N-terminal domain-containing protein n=1 Tax=Rhodanobacter denitrificans TaxID=666685 RepID=UPI001F29D4F1|nr:protein-disulfide reductase DsbD N-terminal domain-containing protein [Rhodanobacter denitrificans]UJJ60564.1 protein-disulfide reductase DsbD N-terminal domain-containing protein [Rhodanobacter denitrificans]